MIYLSWAGFTYNKNNYYATKPQKTKEKKDIIFLKIFFNAVKFNYASSNFIIPV